MLRTCRDEWPGGETETTEESGAGIRILLSKILCPKFPSQNRFHVVWGALSPGDFGTAHHIREKFRSAEAFASWLGLCPDNRISCGRILKAGTRTMANRIANPAPGRQLIEPGEAKEAPREKGEG